MLKSCKNPIEIVGRVQVLERLKSSKYGNPRYSFVVHYSNGTTSDLIKTVTDCSIGYSITNYDGVLCNLELFYYRGQLSVNRIGKVIR